MRIGLVLSGGAARGIAHLGVLQYLEEKGVRPAAIAGTSAGSIVGAYYSAGMTLDQIKAAAADMSWRKLIKISFPRRGLINTTRLLKMLEKQLGQLRFEQLSIPLAVNAVDLMSGQEVVIREGPVAKALAASCAIPGIFTPVSRGKRILVDGGVINNIPVEHIKAYDLDYVIAVNVSKQDPLKREPASIFEVMIQSYHIMRSRCDAHSYGKTDILIEPQLGDIAFYDNSNVDLLVERGYTAARNKLEAIDLSRRFGPLSRWLLKRRRKTERSTP